MSKKFKVAKRFYGRLTNKSYRPGDAYSPPDDATAAALVSKGYIVAVGKAGKAADAPAGDTQAKTVPPADAPDVDLDSLKRAEIDELLTKAGLDPADYGNKQLAITALKELSTAPAGDTGA